MSWEGYTIYQPEEPSDYHYWRKGWHCGLPNAGEISSMTCGAMPFRMEPDGINAKKCLRGEDWAWIMTWFETHFGLAASFLREGKSVSQTGLITPAGPRLRQLCCTMDMTSSIWGIFGQTYDLPNQEVQRDQWEAVLSTGLTNNAQMMQRIPAELNGDWNNAQYVHVPLYLSGVSAIFEDLSKLSCTIGDGSRDGNGRGYYNYYQQNKDTNPTITSEPLSGIYHWDGWYYHNQKQISMRMQPYVILRVRHSDWDGDYRYCTYKCGTPRTVTNTEQNTGRFNFPSTFRGELLAQGACNLLGVSPTPAATGYERKYCEVAVEKIYTAISAWYMQL